MKREVFQAYGYSGYHDFRCVSDANKRICQIDHLFDRDLGGADVVTNLWAEAYGSAPWKVHLKDKLENRLHKEVRAGRLS